MNDKQNYQTIYQKLAAYAAFAWSIVFGLIHVYWAMGGTAGLGKPLGKILMIINFVAIIMCVIASLVALALVQSWGRKMPSWMLLTLAWGACIVLGLRGSVGIIQSMLETGPVPSILIIFEPLFLVGGILFGAAIVLYSNTQNVIKRCTQEKL